MDIYVDISTQCRVRPVGHAGVVAEAGGAVSRVPRAALRVNVQVGRQEAAGARVPPAVRASVAAAWRPRCLPGDPAAARAGEHLRAGLGDQPRHLRHGVTRAVRHFEA